MYVQIYTNKTRKLYIRPNWLHITFFYSFRWVNGLKESNFNGLRAASVFITECIESNFVYCSFRTFRVYISYRLLGRGVNNFLLL